jgi:predicted DsbA family dithiol-disulfide isomerase
MPSQIAGKCALRQGVSAFERFHTAVFRALFGESRDISDVDVLLELAAEAGLDVDRFQADLDDSAHEEAVLAEFEEARAEYEGWGVPLAIIGGRYPVVGAAPIEMYRRAIDLCLMAQA